MTQQRRHAAAEGGGGGGGRRRKDGSVNDRAYGAGPLGGEVTIGFHNSSLTTSSRRK